MEPDVVGFCRLADGTGFAPSFLVHTSRGSHLFHVCACISCGQCSRYRWMARPVPEQVLGSISLRVGMSLQLELLAQGATLAISAKPRPLAIRMISSKQKFSKVSSAAAQLPWSHSVSALAAPPKQAPPLPPSGYGHICRYAYAGFSCPRAPKCSFIH